VKAMKRRKNTEARVVNNNVLEIHNKYSRG